MLWSRLRNTGSYKVSIGAMRLRLQELQESDSKAQKIRVAEQLQEGWKDTKGIFHHQGLSYVPKIIRSNLISRYQDNPFIYHFGVDKTRELIGQKYYWPSLRRDVKAYIKGCNVCLALKVVRHKPYRDL